MVLVHVRPNFLLCSTPDLAKVAWRKARWPDVHSMGHGSGAEAPGGFLSCLSRAPQKIPFVHLKHGFFHQNTGNPPSTRQCSGV